MSKGPAVGNSQEELPVKGAAQRRTDGNDDQDHPQQHPGGQRIEGPEEGLVNAEGQVQQKPQQQGKPAGGKDPATLKAIQDEVLKEFYDYTGCESLWG